LGVPESNLIPTVLVVDGEVLIRTEIAAYLRRCGYRVIEAASGDEALPVLLDDDTIKIVLADVQLAGSLDGFALAQWVRRHTPNVGVMLAGTVQRATVAAGELCEDGPLLSKPYDPQIVADRIRRLVAARQRGE
jgi:DNA-binding response OmpR family regulator